MKKTRLVLIFFFCIETCFAQLPDSLKKYIDSAISIMKDHSLYALRVNWIKAQQQAYKDATGARNKQQLFNTIANVYRQLNDHHGWFEQYNDKISLTDSSGLKHYSISLLKEWAKGPKIKTEMLGKVAYLRIPAMPVINQEQIDFYANWLADSVISLAGKKPMAWIIDLRLNSSGNIIPVMAALAPFFSTGILSYYLDKNNKAVSRSIIKNGIFYLNDTTYAKLQHQARDLRNAKVAVIIGAGTASSGEGVAANFEDRKYTNLFGERSAGMANATEGFAFNNDNSYFLITTAVPGDKKMKPLTGYVTPHIVVKNNDSFKDLMNDNSVKAALTWLH